MPDETSYMYYWLLAHTYDSIAQRIELYPYPPSTTPPKQPPWFRRMYIYINRAKKGYQ